jgi:actin-like ATPase involved in cell morphogenesis
VGTQVTLEMIYDEVKQVNKRLSLIEDAIEEVIVKGLPKVTISKKEKEEIKRSVEEMKKGNCVTLEELKSA